MNTNRTTNIFSINDNNNIMLNQEKQIAIRLEKNCLVIQEAYETYQSLYGPKHTMIDYQNFMERAELREIEYYYKASYFDSKGNKILLNEEPITEQVDYELNLVYMDKNNQYAYMDLIIDNLEIGLEAVKRINKKLKHLGGK